MKTYRSLLRELSAKEKFCSEYTLKHMTVDECFRSEQAIGKGWRDPADKESLAELNQDRRNE